MPTPNAPGIFRVAAEGDLLGDRWANVFHFRQGSVVDESGMNQALTALESFYNALKTRLTNQWDLDRLVATAYVGPASWSLERIPASAIVGTSTSTPLPPDVAVCVSWRTNFIGRSRRGRTYLPGWTSGEITGAGQVSSSTRTAISTACTALSGLSLVDFGIYSRVLNEFNVVSTFFIDDQFDTQRRRGKSQAKARTTGTIAV